MTRDLHIVLQYQKRESIKNYGGIAIYPNQVLDYLDSQSIDKEIHDRFVSGKAISEPRGEYTLEKFVWFFRGVARKMDGVIGTQFEYRLHSFQARIFKIAILKSAKHSNVIIYHHMNNFVLPPLKLLLLSRKFRIVTVSTMVDFLDLAFPSFLPKSVVKQRKVTRDLLFEVSELLLPIAEFIFQDCLKLGFEAEKMRVIHWGADHLLGQDLKKLILDNPEGDLPNFVLPAKSWKHKGHLKMLEAFLSSTTTNYNLTFIGDTSSINVEISNLLIKFPENAARFRNLGFLTEEAKLNLFQTCDGIVLPSLYEGFGFPYFEAAKLSLPLFCFRTKSYEEYFRGCSPIGLVDPYDYKGLHFKLNSFIDKDHSAAVICRRNRIEDLTWISSCQELVKIYKRVISSIGEL